MTNKNYKWKDINGAYTCKVKMEGYEHLNLTAIAIGRHIENPTFIEIICNLGKKDAEWLVCYADCDEFMKSGNLIPGPNSSSIHRGRKLLPV